MAYSYLDRMERTIKQHEDWRLKECLNLIPSENRGTPLSRWPYATDIGGRYTAPDRFYRGTKYLDELEALAAEVARKVFNARYADVRPLSGHTADMAVLMSLTSRGDGMISMAAEDGGYPGITHLGLGRILGLRNLYFPYDHSAVNVDVPKARAVLKAEKPRVAVFGSSFIPFPAPVEELSRDAGEAVCVYDGSHVLGLIAGGEFQDPLREGCSLMIGSTHKSLPGPQGGIILSNNSEVFESVSSNIHPGIVDNVHLNRVAALTVALLEMLEFGKKYAKAVIENSKALAKGLHSRGVKVRGEPRGFTESHQVLLDYGPEKLLRIAARMESANIIMDNGGRLGTSELTHMGYSKSDMDRVAELASGVILGKTAPDVVKKGVRSLVKGFTEPKYVLRSAPKELG
jgi:glycine hydroxymethyltransferase